MNDDSDDYTSDASDIDPMIERLKFVEKSIIDKVPTFVYEEDGAPEKMETIQIRRQQECNGGTWFVEVTSSYSYDEDEDDNYGVGVSCFKAKDGTFRWLGTTFQEGELVFTRKVFSCLMKHLAYLLSCCRTSVTVDKYMRNFLSSFACGKPVWCRMNLENFPLEETPPTSLPEAGKVNLKIAGKVILKIK